jgi:hypothetical protein
VNEILAYIERDGERWIVVWFAAEQEFRDLETPARIEIIPDAPYWWRRAGMFLDRSEECS